MANELSKDDMLRFCKALVDAFLDVEFYSDRVGTYCYHCTGFDNHDDNCPVGLAERYIEEVKDGE